MSELAAERKRAVGHQIQTARAAPVPGVPLDEGLPGFAEALTARIKATKSRLLEGGFVAGRSNGVSSSRTPA